MMKKTKIPNLPLYIAVGRDSKRSRVYEAEARAFPQHWHQGWSREQTIDFLRHVIGTRWFRARWPHFGTTVVEVDHADRRFMVTGIGVEFRRGGGGEAFTVRKTIAFGATGTNLSRALAVHELAHLVSPSRARHGRYFCKVYLLLVERFLGVEEYRALRKEFVRAGIKFRSERKLSPAAREAAVKRGRALAARRKLSLQDAKEAVDEL